MHLFLKILRISAMVLLIFVLAVLAAPTPTGGGFVIIHFATTLKTWLMAQLLFLGLTIAAHLLMARFVIVRSKSPEPLPILSGFKPAVEPLRC